MKVRTQPIIINFKTPKLYKNDILRITGILEKNSKEGKLSIETDKMEYASSDELLKSTDAATKMLKIYGSVPHVTLDFTGLDAKLYISENSIQERGIANSIAEIVQKRERKTLWYFTRFPTFLAGAIVFNAVSATIRILGHVPSQKTSLAFGIFGLLWGLTCTYYHIYGASKVRLLEQKGFFAENRDAILITLIGAVAGSLVTIMLSHLLGL